MRSELAFGMLWATLALGPVMALGVFYAISIRSVRAARWVAFGAALALAALILCTIAGVGFVWPLVNLATFCAAYLAYALLVGATDLVRRPIVRRSLKLVGWAPFVLGWFAATVGALALVLIARDYASGPVLTERFDGGLVCERSVWSGVGTASGVSVDLYREWRPLPLRRRLVSIVVRERDLSSRPQDATCAEALEQASRS